MQKFKIYNEVKGFRVPRKNLGEAFGKFLKLERVSGKFEVNLVFVGKMKMRGLNERWHGGKGSTDVLSFDYEGGVGEIYICVEVAHENAAAEGSALLDEVLALFVHGLLHLVGYTHETRAKYARMMERGEKVLG